MGKRLKIAIVDDNADFFFTMETFLQRNGFEVLTAADGQEKEVELGAVIWVRFHPLTTR